jgi:hypothetical protein
MSAMVWFKSPIILKFKLTIFGVSWIIGLLIPPKPTKVTFGCVVC